MFALSPVVTALLSFLLRVRPPGALGLAGIGLGLVGALIIVFGRNSVELGGEQIWLFLALLIPAFLGAGNVYRTMAWPDGAEPRLLAATTNLAAVLPLAALAAWVSGGLPVAALFGQPVFAAMQLASSTVMFMTFFRLQQVGGPTYLSQIGYVAAAVGLLVGVLVMGERYPLSVWAGAAVIAAGVGISTLSQMRQSPA
jgi:drug/metabolite transporter (DMT)-like permease